MAHFLGVMTTERVLEGGIRPAVRAILACHRCGLDLDDGLACPNGEFRLRVSDGLIAAGGGAGHQFTNYSLEKGVPDHYQTGELVEHEYYLRLLPAEAGLMVDCGGGDGNASSLWARKHPEAELVVVDMDEFALRRAQRRGLANLTVMRASCDRVPLRAASVDTVFSSYMVEHLYDWELSRFYLEAWRMLRPGGSLVVQSDAAFFDKFIHPVLRLLRAGQWRTSAFLERWDTGIRAIHHHNLKTAREQRAVVERHGFFVQGVETPMLFSNRKPVAALYEIAAGVIPAAWMERFLATSYTIVAVKPAR